MHARSRATVYSLCTVAHILFTGIFCIIAISLYFNLIPAPALIRDALWMVFAGAMLLCVPWSRLTQPVNLIFTIICLGLGIALLSFFFFFFVVYNLSGG